MTKPEFPNQTRMTNDRMRRFRNVGADWLNDSFELAKGYNCSRDRVHQVLSTFVTRHSGLILVSGFVILVFPLRPMH
jgi:hypothetical protein